MLEAIDANVQLVVPRQERVFSDGVDDILSCVKFHENINDIDIYDNSDTILKAKHFKKFYSTLLEQEFHNPLKRSQYSHFYDWCVDQI